MSFTFALGSVRQYRSIGKKQIPPLHYIQGRNNKGGWDNKK